MKRFLIAFGFSLGMFVHPSSADSHFTSGPAHTSLLELFTSEGCSSCPPAEARLSRLKDDPGLWKRFVPVAYHVDYWDRLGWRDRFASPDFTARQHRYAALWQSESVYTPAFVRDGRELRGGLTDAAPAGPAAGVLEAKSEDGKSWSISFRPAAGESGEFEAHVALLGAGIYSKIGAGENGGRNLQHDFVVLSQRDSALMRTDDQLDASLTTPAPAEKAPRQAVAIWVTRRGELAPVQATGGWLAAR